MKFLSTKQKYPLDIPQHERTSNNKIRNRTLTKREKRLLLDRSKVNKNHPTIVLVEIG